MVCIKIRYVTKKIVRKNKKKIESKYWYKTSIYICPKCSYYHLTSAWHDKKSDIRRRNILN
jgi:hypothetical protein